MPKDKKLRFGKKAISSGKTNKRFITLRVFHIPKNQQPTKATYHETVLFYCMLPCRLYAALLNLILARKKAYKQSTLMHSSLLPLVRAKLAQPTCNHNIHDM
jgi:hypothetical protein